MAFVRGWCLYLLIYGYTCIEEQVGQKNLQRDLSINQRSQSSNTYLNKFQLCRSVAANHSNFELKIVSILNVELMQCIGNYVG